MTISDKINRAFETILLGAKITSASPEHVNTVFLLEEMDHSDFESDIREIVQEELELSGTQDTSKTDVITTGGSGKGKSLASVETQVNNVEESLGNLDDSLGGLADMTNTQITVLQGFSKNPFQFMLSNFFKKFAKGAGIVALATIIFAAVQLIISELLKPGRLLDRRFKRIAKDEILLFNSVQEQAELRQGFKTVIITTMSFLSGGEVAGQISGNLYNPTRVPMDRIDPRRAITPIVSSQNGSRSSNFSGSKFFSMGRSR